MSETKRRITVAEVQAAYLKTGLKPVRGVFRKRDEKCNIIGGCAMTALAAAAGIDIQNNQISQWAEMRYGDSYARQVWAGFDGRSADIGTLGYQDGLAVAAAIFGEPANG